MAIEQFNYRKPANSAREGVVPVSQAWGTRVHATDRVGSAGTSVVPAGLYSTAPFIDPAGVAHPSPMVMNAKPSARHDAGPPTCSATRADGAPCTAKAVSGELCRWHRGVANKEKTD